MFKLREAIDELEAQSGLDVRELSAHIDRLQAILCRELHEATRRGDHVLEGKTPNAWAASACRVSASSASDRLCVGEQLNNLPRVAEALRSGDVGYQAAAVICHLSDLLGEKRGLVDEEKWLEYSKQFSIKNLRRLAEHARFVADPEGAERDSEEDYEQRYLHLSELGAMYKLDAVLDRECGMALRTALESLTKRLGETDNRTPKQRRADAFKEIVQHSLDQGTLPKRNGARPQLAVHFTVDGLKGELADGMPIPGKTVQRLACDCSMHRVVKAESMAIDVGRAKRTAQPAQWRALKARHRTCAAPGCERPIGWTQAHHLEFWSRGGQTNAHRLIPLCYYHHRLVHEGGWQVVMAGERVDFIPPETPLMLRRRWGESRWAA